MRRVLLLPLLLAACTTAGPGDNAFRPGLTERGKAADIRKAATYNLLTTEVGAPIGELAVNHRDLHGKFFKDRVWFYVIENPELYLADTQVSELTLIPAMTHPQDILTRKPELLISQCMCRV